MINSVPNNSSYHQGNFVPSNKDKVMKLNSFGGIYYRSSLEKKFMTYLDINESIIRWSSEMLEIPYTSKEVIGGEVVYKNRRYYPDFYYEMKSGDQIKMVVAEVKPKSEYNDVILFREGKFVIPKDPSTKKLKNLEYKFKMSQKNSAKWETMIEFCQKKGYEFIIITDEILNRF
jgi:hypothetical protein